MLLLIACTGGAAVIGTPVECDTGCEDTAPPEGGEHLIQLSINEIMAENGESLLTDAGETPDWFELYNASDIDIDLDGFLVRDDLESDEPEAIDGTLIVPAGGFALILADGAPGEGADHLLLKLNSGGEDLGIYTPDDQAIDLITYGEQVRDLALARTEDGGEEWTYIAGGTPGESNE